MSKLIYLIVGAILCYLSYFVSSYFVFVLFIPFFYLIKSINSKRSFLYIFAFILIQNIIPTYWLSNIQIYQGISAWVVNSLLLFLFVFLAIIITNKRKETARFLTIISFWILFEYLHHIWVFNWLWLTIGNVFANEVSAIQWYKYTGVMGGSFWILIINFLSFRLNIKLKKYKTANLLILLAGLISPILISSKMYHSTPNTHQKALKVVIVSPNSNTTNKYINELDVLKNVFDSSVSNSDVVLLTETFVKESIWQNRIEDGVAIQKIENYLKRLKISNCITGLLIKKIAQGNTGKNYNQALNIRYDLYDAAICIDTFSKYQFHYKSKLIPVEENVPDFLSSFNLKTDNFSIGNDFNNFTINNGVVVSTGICFETLFTNVIANMCNKGSSIIFMIANEQLIEGFYEKNSYTNICKLRAIENGKYLAKSSNIGYTVLIDPKGNVIERLKDNAFGVKKVNIPIVIEQTFYTKNYQIINLFIIIQALIFLIYSLSSNMVIFFRKRMS